MPTLECWGRDREDFHSISVVNIRALIAEAYKAGYRDGHADKTIETVEAGPAPLTKRQHEILSFLSEYMTDNGFAPTLGEIATKFSCKSLATVHEHLTNLEKKRYIKRSPNLKQSIQLLST